MLPIKLFIFTLLTRLGFCEPNDVHTNLKDKDKEGNCSKRMENEFTIELKDLLNLGDDLQPLKNPVSMRDSASKFLLQAYSDFKEEQAIDADDDEVEQIIANHKSHSDRFTRSIWDASFITEVDHKLIRRCNNIVTFSCKAPGNERTKFPQVHSKYISAMMINFNTNNVPDGMKLVHATFRIYQEPTLGVFEENMITRKISISVHSTLRSHTTSDRTFRIVNTINSTTSYKGWYEFNITHTLSEWLKHTRKPTMEPNEIVVLVGDPISENNAMDIGPNDIGLIEPDVKDDLIANRPFITSYFIGPVLLTKIHKIRTKRKAYYKLNRKADQYYRSTIPNIYHLPLTCERINFTLHFKDLGMHDWVIAPKRFEAFFCAGQCNFPLAASVKPTNHAIIQTLMHLKDPRVPKACCVPIKLGSISILHYLDDDAVNLSKYPQSVALECGCH